MCIPLAVKKQGWLFLVMAILSLTGLSHSARAAFDSAKQQEAAKTLDLEISRIIPSGQDIPLGRQIVIQFNQAVVPVGKMERTAAEIPITITPALECQWRWLNTSALACQLDEKNALKPATRYQVTIKPSTSATAVLKTESGKLLKAEVNHEFITQRPTSRTNRFQTWRAPNMPIIRVSFNQPVTKASVEAHLFMKKSNGQRVPIVAQLDLATGQNEDSDYDYDTYSQYEQAYGEYGEGQSPVNAPKVQQADVANIWLISAKSLLPLDATLSLAEEAGLESSLGTERGVNEKVIVEFNTFPEFAFLGVQCVDLQDNEIKINAEDKADPSVRCNPMRPVALRFSAPILNSIVRDNLLVTPDLAGGRKDFNPWEEVQDSSSLNSSHAKGEEYLVWLPTLLKAYRQYQFRANNANVKDEFGRALNKAINLSFFTDNRNPDFTFEHQISVLEKGVDSELPVYITNLNKLTQQYRVITDKGMSSIKSRLLSLPKLRNVSVKIPFGIREILSGGQAPAATAATSAATTATKETESFASAKKTAETTAKASTESFASPKKNATPATEAAAPVAIDYNQSGIVVGSFKTEPSLVENPPTFFTQVTPFYVQAKMGYHNTLVWVMDFATGKPVENAEVIVFTGNYLTPLLIAPANAGEGMSTKTDAAGLAMLAGHAQIDPTLSLMNNYSHENDRLMVQVKKDGDIALLPLDYEFNVSIITADNDYSIYPYERIKHGHIKTWGMTAQGIYKVGDTIQYKIYVRDQGNLGLIAAPTSKYVLTVVDPMGNNAFEAKDLTLSEFGTLQGEFKLGEHAPVGRYQFSLSADFYPNNTWYPLQVLVSDFTPSPFKVTTTLNQGLYQIGEVVKVNTLAALHAGGPYVDAPATVYATLSQESFEPTHPLAKGFNFDTYKEDVYDDTVFQTSGKVDGKGELHSEFKIADTVAVLYGKLSIESGVSDERGKTVANQTTANFVGRDLFVGLKNTDWLGTVGKPSSTQVLVVDPKGMPTAGVPVDVQIERRETKASRVKGAGNAYLTQFVHEWVKVSNCQITTTVSASNCQFTPPQAGTYQIIAKIKDTKGREHSTQLNQWVVGSGSVVWETDTGNGLTVIPEQESYKVGEKARYLVQNPYPNAQALVTVERYGVMKSWVTTLADSVATIEVPVEADYSPGFFVSITVMSPRVKDKPIDDEGVDLGKPAFRMGYAKTDVEDPYKALAVELKTNKPVYKPREEVTLDLQVKSPSALAIDEPTEVAVVVLDEAVFDLITGGRNYFDLYKGFYDLESLDVGNYSLLMRLVGRQKFEKKGASAGGDGGLSPSMRSLFRFVSYWNPSLKTDASGKAQVKFTVPDNLTGWRVFALAATPTDRLGLSDMNFKVNQPIELRPVLPNQVTIGDSFTAGFSVMNRTEAAQDIKVSIKAAGALAQPMQAEQTVKAEPFKRYNVWLPLKTSSEGEIKFVVEASSATEKDGLQQTLLVRPRRAFDVAATYGTTEQKTVSESVKVPADVIPELGSIDIIVSPTVISDLDSSFEYMEKYPYVCWEQKLSKGTMASHYQNLKAYLNIPWAGSETLAQATLDLAQDYQAPNGGMAYFIAEDTRVSPYLSAYTALTFQWARKSGLKVPDMVENKLQAYLETFLRRDVQPTFYSTGMTSSVRAVALAALSSAQKVTREDLRRYQPHVKEMDLFGKAHYLLAALNVPQSNAIRKDVAQQILAAADQTSGRVSFQETLDDSYKHLLTSPVRTQCAILSALVQYDEQAQDNLVSDLPFKLARGIIAERKYGGRWENTQENLFCMNALTDYTRVYEKTQPQMVVRTFLNDKALNTVPVVQRSANQAPVPTSTPAPAASTEVRFNSVKDAPAAFSTPLATAGQSGSGTVKIDKEGAGRLYYSVKMRYALKDEKAAAVNSGMDIRREYHVRRNDKWELLTSPMKLQTGDLVRVDLYLSLPAPRYLVVVDDPVPGGLEPVNRDLATSSQRDANAAKSDYAGGSLWYQFSDWHNYGIDTWSFYHKELRHHAAIFYSDYLPVGNYHLSYTAQAIAAGEFSVMGTKAEEMYDPEVYGRAAAAKLIVERKD